MEKPGSTLKRSDAFESDEHEGRPAPQPGLLLVFSSGRPMSQPIAIPQAELELGRENLGIKLEDGKISRSHVRVSVKDGAFLASDLGSLNGTVVDGQQLPSRGTRPLTRVLRLGDTLLLPVPDLHTLKTGNLIVQEGLVIGPRLFELYQRIGRAAASSSTLHITGESGSGKENAARAFHNASPGRGPFIAVNCATIPEGIAERLLFGAKRGAFSGVVADSDGYIQASSGGTLFLDEVAELHATVQAKLLRVLETKEVLAVGAVKAQPVMLRVVSASHRSLHAEVSAGRLREDLYYRIGRPAERVPPLRERPEEISWLIHNELAKTSKIAAHSTLVESCILRHWPGNIRELLVEVRAAAQEAAAAESKRIKAEHLTAGAGLLIKTQPLPAPPPAEASAPISPPQRPREPSPVEPARPSRTQIIAAIIEANGNLAEAARQLSLQRSKLRREIAYHNIDVRQLRDPKKG